MSSENALKIAPDPFEEIIELILGKDSYPTPPKLTSILSTDPVTFGDFVVYFKVVVFVDVYEVCSGILDKLILNVVDPIPVATKSLLYTLLFKIIFEKSFTSLSIETL